MNNIIHKIENKEFFKFPKLLHGFWERLDFLTDGIVDVEILKNKIKIIGDNFGNNNFNRPPFLTNFFNVKSSLGVGNHYLDIIDHLQNPKPNIIWGISEKDFNINSSMKENPNSSRWIKEIVKSDYIDGCFWKDVILLDLFDLFLESIKDFEVIVIGMKHLRQMNMKLKFKNFHFIEVEMPLAKRAKEFQLFLENFHKKIKKPSIYLTQMSIDGVSIICDLKIEDSFFFDLGRALDVFGEKPFSYHWENQIPREILKKYEKKTNCKFL